MVIGILLTYPVPSPAQSQSDNETHQTITHDLVFTRQFEASVDQIWKAWSESDYVKQWWGAHGFTTPVADIDFRAGGSSFGHASEEMVQMSKTGLEQNLDKMAAMFSDKFGVQWMINYGEAESLCEN